MNEKIQSKVELLKMKMAKNNVAGDLDQVQIGVHFNKFDIK